LIFYIDQIIRKYNMKGAGYDDWEAFNIIPKLVELGHNFLRFPQNYSTFNAPIKELYKYINQNKVNHFNNPVTRWQVSNVVLKTDPGGRVKYDKDKSSDKIDGVVSLTMGVGVCMALSNEPEFRSVYEDRGVSTIE
jgi:phage terminase large subunit-like protein